MRACNYFDRFHFPRDLVFAHSLTGFHVCFCSSRSHSLSGSKSRYCEIRSQIFFFLNFGLFAVWLPRNCLKDFLASKQCADVVMFKRLLNNGVVLMFGSEKACSKIRESEVRGSASNRAMVNHELFATSILVIHMVLIWKYWAMLYMWLPLWNCFWKCF